MSKLYTLATFATPSEMHVVRSKLESEGIRCVILNELTVQSHNFLSNAIGGIELQVHEKDYKNAIQVLKESGYDIENTDQTGWVHEFLSKKTNQQFVNNSLKVFGTLMTLLVIGVLTNYAINIPSLNERLSSKKWCMNHMIFENQIYDPYTIRGLTIGLTLDECHEHVIFYKDGSLKLPGFNTNKITGKWSLFKDSLRIYEIDTLGYVFNRNYKCSYEDKTLVLSSEQATIICY